MTGLTGCHLYSLQDGCGPLYDGGVVCMTPTSGSSGTGATGTGGITSGGTTNGGTSTGGTTGGVPCNANGLPCAPSSVQATAAKDAVDLTWTSASGNGSAVTGYIVTPTPAGGPGALNLGDVSAAVFPSLTPGTSYTFSVVALSANGHGPAGVSNAVVPFDVPGPPSNVTVLPGPSQVAVSWSAAPGNGLPITGYTVTASPGSQVAASDGGVTTATVIGLTNATSYTFNVVAINDAGVGPPATSSATTPYALVTTLAGNGHYGFHDGTGGPNGDTQFDEPLGAAVDALGYVYIADQYNFCIRKIAPDGTTTTFAGNGTRGHTDGTGGLDSGVQFNYLAGVAMDPQGNVYVAESGNNDIRKIAPDGTTTTLAGNGFPGYSDGPPDSGIEFDGPTGVAVDSQGYVYVADTNNSLIRRVAPDGTTSTYAGTHNTTFPDGGRNPDALYGPTGVAVDAQGYLYVADNYNNRIVKVDLNGNTSTLAGNGSLCDAGRFLAGCYADGTGGPTGTAAFSNPFAVAVGANGYIYVADTGNLRIRLVAPDGTTTTLAGNGAMCAILGGGCFADGPGSPDPDGGASFNYPEGIAVDIDGGVYVSDTSSQRIRKIFQ